MCKASPDGLLVTVLDTSLSLFYGRQEPISVGPPPLPVC